MLIKKKQQNRKSSGIFDLGFVNLTANRLVQWQWLPLAVSSRGVCQVSDEILLFMYFILENSCWYVLPNDDDIVEG